MGLSSSVSVVSPNKDWAKAALESSAAFFFSAALDGEDRGVATGEITGAPVPGGGIDPGAPGGGGPFNGLY